MKLIGVAALAAILAAGAASAQPFNGAAKIVRGDYVAAEHELAAARTLQPDNVELTLNLAAVYAQTGRPMLARAMYARVARMTDEDMVLANGSTVAARTVAARAIARLPAIIAVN